MKDKDNSKMSPSDSNAVQKHIGKLDLSAYNYGMERKEKYLETSEQPSEKGIADAVYLPKHKSMLSALVIELKWNKSFEGAVGQIKKNNYPAVLARGLWR